MTQWNDVENQRLDEDEQVMKRPEPQGGHARQGYGAEGRMTDEATEILACFAELLRPVIADGARKREAHAWQTTPSERHWKAFFRHYMRWVNGERVDPDSGAHPLVHVAFRALAIAWQETAGRRD